MGHDFAVLMFMTAVVIAWMLKAMAAGAKTEAGQAVSKGLVNAFLKRLG